MGDNSTNVREIKENSNAKEIKKSKKFKIRTISEKKAATKFINKETKFKRFFSRH